MADYNSVNNPFITLRKLSGNEEKSFTTNLNTSPPIYRERQIYE